MTYNVFGGTLNLAVSICRQTLGNVICLPEVMIVTMRNLHVKRRTCVAQGLGAQWLAF